MRISVRTYFRFRENSFPRNNKTERHTVVPIQRGVDPWNYSFRVSLRSRKVGYSESPAGDSLPPCDTYVWGAWKITDAFANIDIEIKIERERCSPSPNAPANIFALLHLPILNKFPVNLPRNHCFRMLQREEENPRSIISWKWKIIAREEESFRDVSRLHNK